MTTSSDQEHSTFDRMLDALGSRKRRQLLVHLMKNNPREEAKLVDELNVGEVNEQFSIRLHHVDLPKLVELAYIEWDHEFGRITKGHRFDEIRPLLDLLARHEDDLPNDLF